MSVCQYFGVYVLVCVRGISLHPRGKAQTKQNKTSLPVSPLKRACKVHHTLLPVLLTKPSVLDFDVVVVTRYVDWA